MNKKKKGNNRSRMLQSVANVVAFAAVFMLIFTMGSIKASAQGATNGTINGSVTYTYDGSGKLTVSGTGDMANYENQQYQPWRGYAGEITSVVIEQGVTSVGNWTFYGLENLTSISIADSVTKIGDRAFCGCTRLASISIPSTVQSIGEWAFAASPITSVRVVNGSIGAYAFYGCGNLGTVILGNGITAIGASAFEGCTGLKEHGYVSFEGTSAEWNAVKANISTSGNDCLLGATFGYKTGCGVNGDNLNWNVEGSVLTITGTGDMKGFPVYNQAGHPLCMPWYAYKDQITKIVIGEGVTSIGQSAFREFTALTSVTIPGTVKSVGFAAFADDTALTEADLNCDYIGESAFIRCSNLKKVTIGPNVKASGVSAFENCTSLKEVYIQDLAAWCKIDFGGFLSTPMRAAGNAKLFVNGGEVTNLTIPDGVTEIGDYCFEFFTGISSVTVPASVSRIGDYAFYNDSQLATVGLSEGLSAIGGAAFTGTMLSNISIPQSVSYIGPYSFAYAPVGRISVSQGTIGDYAFLGCGNLIRADIGANVKNVGISAFANCNALANGASDAGVFYGGTRAQWQALCINIEAGNECLTNNVKSYSVSDVGTAVTVKDSYIGKNIVFGTYKQGGAGEVQNINWTVLDYNESAGTALLISRDVLDFQMYYGTLDNTPVTWENSELRSWLNNDFYNQAFDANGKSYIRAYSATGENNARFGTNGGNTTSDNVFILSASEIERYMPVVSDRMSKCTDYAKSRNSDSALLHPVLQSSYWWVRTPGMFDYDAEYVHYMGTVMTDGMAVQNIIGGVRPCIVIDAQVVTSQITLEDKTFGGNDDPVQAFVERLYNLVLLRSADASGLADWTGKLKSGENTGAKVAEGFFMSQEMINRHVSNEEYVKICYRVMMNREADPAGLADWVDKLDNGMSRYFVLSGFTNSQEFGLICAGYGITSGQIYSNQARDVNYGITSFVARCYTKVLEREFDEDGMNSWCQSLLDANDKRLHAENVASNGFFHSQEYLNKNTSNEEYVNTLYRTFLGREADPAGYADWKGKLDAGVNRDEVLYGFSRSAEFAEIMASYGL